MQPIPRLSFPLSLLLSTLLLIPLLQGCSGGGGSGSVLLFESETELVAIGLVEDSQPTEIIVNGLGYDATNAEIRVNGESAPRDHLKPGHIVRIRGQVEDDGTSTADLIELNSNVVGPVCHFDSDLKLLMVLGQSIFFDTATELDPEIEALLQSRLIVGERIQVSGRNGQGEKIEATRIELASPDADERVLGTISNLDTNNFLFTINNLTIDHSRAFLFDLPGGFPANGVDVIVGGDLQDNLLLATVVIGFPRLEESEFDTRIRLDGLVTRYASDLDFGVDTFSITTTTETEFLNGDRRDLRLGVRVGVEGELVSGITQADRITFGRLTDETGTVRFPLAGFDEVSVGSAFRVTLEQDPDFDVEVTVDADVLGLLNVTQDGSGIRIGFRQTGGNIESETLEARIKMPDLSRVNLQGAAQATLIGFQEPTLDIRMQGAASLRAVAVSAESLVARLQGASNLQLADISSLSQVDIEMQFASSATVNVLPSGSITGSLTFGSTLFYYGRDLDLDVSTAMGSSVQRLGDTRF